MNLSAQKKRHPSQALFKKNMGMGAGMMEAELVAAAAQQGEHADATEQRGGWLGDGSD